MPKRKYSRKHRGGGGQCSSLGCKDDKIPDSDKIVMANNFLNQNKTEYTEIYNKVLAKIHNKFYKNLKEGIDENTKLDEAFEKPKNAKNASTFSSNCNMFRDNLFDRLKSGYMEELKGKDNFIVVLSVIERQLITQQSKDFFEKEFNEKKAAEEKERQDQENQRLKNERTRLENEKKRQTAKNKNPFTQNRKTRRRTDRDTRSNIIENKFDVVLSTARNKSQNSLTPK
jgi:hypothetical protein